ncbi:glycosyltransferase family 9 protein [Mesorhizobium sp. STM 4661]|uniref:glycosyltransferase family 9 protein n=1 Tax=Mesorhizobium sp. STM 4661 TaxID=1297570 RepID=UPI0002BD396D|nr:glycosyltransferase family 9 protein [Mesorhizobium sp. STM 4661]CCV10360.1 Glycosyl transferase family 9 [Mesorhizobium sp. STM 4661]
MSLARSTATSDQNRVVARTNIQSILVNQTKFIGDVILTSVLTRHLRATYPKATIALLCASGLEHFVVALGIADIAIPFGRRRMRGTPYERASELYRVTSTIRRQKFDVTIDLSDSKTSRILTRLINAPIRVGFDPPESPLRIWEMQPANVFAATYGHGGEHYLYRYLSPLTALGIELEDPVPSLQPVKACQDEARELLARHKLARGSFVAVHAGASFEGRCWQPERFASAIGEIYERSGLAAVVVGGPDETPIAQKVLDAATSPVVSLVGKASLEVLAALLSEAFIFLGNESGPMHLAAAVKTPVVGLFGLTSPDIWGPLGVPNRTLRPSMPCQCTAKGICKEDETGRVYCVQRLEVADVAKSALELIDVLRRDPIAV